MNRTKKIEEKFKFSNKKKYEKLMLLTAFILLFIATIISFNNKNLTFAKDDSIILRKFYVVNLFCLKITAVTKKITTVIFKLFGFNKK